MSDVCYRCREPVLTPRKPTKAERAWMQRLQRVLLDAPEGIGLLTIGDARLTVYDRKAAQENGIEHLHDGGCDTHGLTLGSVASAVPIEGVSG